MSLAQNRSPVNSSVGIWDFVTGLLSWRLWAFLGLQDIRQRYRRSSFGPLWLAAGLGVTILGIGVLYSQILKVPANTYIPFLAISLLIWNTFSSVLIESTSLFQGGAGMITVMKIPYTTFVLRCITRNLIVAAHCAVPVVIAYVFYRYPLHLAAIWALPGLLMLLANLYWMSLLIAIICLRFRDVAQIVIYTVQIMLFISPILWLPTQISPTSPAVLFNPFYHLLSVVRAPIYQGLLPGRSWSFDAVLLVVGTAATATTFILNRRKLVYWL